jgi:hypothetical protein
VANALSPLTRRWRQLDARSQTIASVGALLLIVAILYAYVWLPAARERERLTARLPQLSAQLALMQRQAGEVRALNGATAIAPAPPVTADTTALQSLFGEGTQASIDANRGFRIVIPKISYAKWWDRLGDADVRHQLQLVHLTLRALPGNNREVSIDMTLADKRQRSARADR